MSSLKTPRTPEQHLALLKQMALERWNFTIYPNSDEQITLHWAWRLIRKMGDRNARGRMRDPYWDEVIEDSVDQAHAARRLGVSPSTISRYLTDFPPE